MTRVTVELERIARLARGGRGSMYAEREYERVQFVGLIAEDAMKPPQPSPPLGSSLVGMPALASVSVQFPTIGTMLHGRFSESDPEGDQKSLTSLGT